jgi:hypothetical protein
VSIGGGGGREVAEGGQDMFGPWYIVQSSIPTGQFQIIGYSFYVSLSMLLSLSLSLAREDEVTSQENPKAKA